MVTEDISWKALVLLSLLCSPITLTHAQTNAATAQIRPALQILDSTKEQDGLLGSVRRVKTEYARISLKESHPSGGPRQLLEVTTYGVKGNRLDNVSYPIAGSTVGREEYKYDSRGNIIEKILRDDSGVVLSREAYEYVFDDVGNWTKMSTSLVVVENGELRHEPTEVTYRTLTYYASDTNLTTTPAATAKRVESPEVVPRRERTEKISAESTDEPGNANGSTSTSTPAPTAEIPAVGSPAAEIFAASLITSSDSYSLRTERPSEIRMISDPAPPPRNVRLVDTATHEGRAISTNSESRKNSETERAPTASSVVNPPSNTAASAPATNKAFDLYKIGRQRFEIGDVNAAIDAYAESLRIEPASAEVQMNLGHAYLTVKKDKDAMKAFKEAVRLNPELAEAYYGLGFVSFRAAKFREAMDAFKRAIALIPDMAKAHYGLALAYIELQRMDDMIQEYRILQRLDGKLAAKLSQAFPNIDRCTGTRYCK